MAFLAAFVFLFLFWLVLSVHFDWFHLLLGVISSAIVAYGSSDLLFKNVQFSRNPIKIFRFFHYLPWLFYQIVVANIHIAKLALHPRMMQFIDPRIIKFKTRLKGDLPLTTFGNSITLTPGTITVLIKDGFYYVHALDEHVAKGLPGDMEKRVGRIHLEAEDGAFLSGG
jgi:multicomponent Na+:H+ antiporter subunit E